MIKITRTFARILHLIRCWSIFRNIKWMQLSPTPTRIRSTNGIRRYYAKVHQLLKIRNDYILYESYSGVGMIDNPYAMFLKLVKDPIYKNYQHFWVINDPEEQKRLRRRYPNKHIHFIAKNTDKYLELLASAKYLINNVTFAPMFSKKEEQIYISTWHSITMKTLGYDTPLGGLTGGNVVRNFLMADYLFAANTFMANIFRKSYKLEGIYEGKIIEEGFPRNDLLINANRPAIIEKMKCYGVNIETKKKIILYAPTWKGANLLNPTNETEEYLEFERKILENIDSNEYQILIKPHQAVYKKLSENDLASGKYIPATLDTNEILSAVDILISDYSSIVFDYMHQDKPILFYIPDLESYNEYRGIYFQPEELPGPATDKIEDIIYWIQNIENYDQQYGECFQEYKKWVCEYDDGRATERIIDCIFHNKEKKYRVYQVNQTNKKKILMYSGGFAMNGVTSTIRYRLKHLDYSKYDLSLIVVGQVTDFFKETLESLDPSIRILRRMGPMILTKEESEVWQKYQEMEVDGEYIDPKIELIFNREFIRCFGNAHFDYCIDYSGYSPFWPYLLMQDKKAKQIIWQHSVMHLDAGNEMKSRQKSYLTHNRSLLATISLYPFMDKIVSVGKCAFEQNQKYLATEKTKSKFTYVYNLVAYETILEEAKKDYQIRYCNQQYYGDSGSIIEEKNRFKINFVTMPDKKNFNFMAMGRLSAEKNFVNLIYAFHKAHQQNSNIRLYIVGKGDLFQNLYAQIEQLGLQNIVFLVGQLMNPFAFAKHCDCFIMPSLYEGLCTSVLEARVLNMPIIMSNFSTAEDVSVENGQIMTDMTSEGIYDGIIKFINKEKKIDYTFDPISFNHKAIKQFDQLLL